MVGERSISGLERYRAVLGIPTAKTLLTATFIGHIPTGMVTLTLLLGVSDASGSYSAGGLATGLYVVASGAVAPLCGRLTDRFGAWLVLPVMALAYVSACVALVLTMVMRAPLELILTAVVITGMCRPVLPGAAQSLWSHLTTDGSDARKAAYALHATQLGLVWILGPMIVTGMTGIFGQEHGPLVSLIVAGVLTSTGALLVARAWKQHGLQGNAEEATRTKDGKSERLYRWPYIVMLVSIVMFEAAVGAGFVTMAVFAEDHGMPSVTGVLVSVWFVGSMTGGAWFGMTAISWPLVRQYRWLLVALATGWGVCALANNLWFLGFALLAAGLALSPIHTVQYSLIANLAPARSRAEGFTWLSTTTGTGGALGSSLAGPAVELFDGTHVGFVLAAVFALAAAAMTAPALIGGKEL